MPAATAVVGTASDDEYAFTARLAIGDEENGRACSGALIATSWVLTAASCFAEDPATGTPPAAGAPPMTTVATIGRADLTTESGQERDVVELVPHESRDLVLARLFGPVPEIEPVEVAAGPPAVGSELVVPGYGRTATEWAPLRRHAGTFVVDSVSGGDIAVTGQDGAAVCAGDTGGPALRLTADGPRLAAVNSRSWQGGCFGSDPAETRTGALEARVDDVAGWIEDVVRREEPEPPPATPAICDPSRCLPDFSGDKKADVVGVDSDGYYLWHFPQAAGNRLGSGQRFGPGWDSWDVVMAADWSGDGTDDVVGVDSDGDLWYYPHQRNDDGVDHFSRRIQIGHGWDVMTTVMAADWTGNGRADMLAVNGAGDLLLYERSGTGSAMERPVRIGHGWDQMRLVAAEDGTRDGRADIFALDGSGKLWLYPHTGSGNGFGTRIEMASGWDDYTTIVAADWSGDGTADIIGRNAGGDLYYHAHWYNSTDGHYFADPVKISQGWGSWLHLA
ncbi:FG-GAP-like repeat-containing protein [Myceligenerans pegani]|uniref:Trypsin-like serine protease n=1 Tax=Myceligenerans pegani TaxID=2776917 RepID=A0ABR9N4N6_9MICO|nr:FG-GAP-like repeat-containing protein [Myceligenerans sp. TRM 65318]MBE1878305.1 trypsin-like serine protease [Myceligenerans sp. TRM 65318]MBE3020576.1 trypsin-like serine protease [Myceligenerans sp. TRM 65318]